MNKPYKHHYVPQFLIKKFSANDNGGNKNDYFPVFLHDLEKFKVAKTTPNNILYEKYFYSFSLSKLKNFVKFITEQGIDIELFHKFGFSLNYEKIWDGLDGHISKIYNVINETNYHSANLAPIPLFFAVFYFRTLKSYKQGIAMTSSLSQKMKSILNLSDDKLKEIAGEELNDDENKDFFYHNIFIEKKTLEYFVPFSPIILESDNHFILGDTPVVLLNMYNDNIIGNGPAKKGTFCLSPISKNLTLLLLPIDFYDLLIDRDMKIKASKNIYDCVTKTTLNKKYSKELLNYLIHSVFKIREKSGAIIRYKCNKNDVALLNFLQIANSDRFIISSNDILDTIKKHFRNYPDLKRRNELLTQAYLKISENKEENIYKKIREKTIDGGEMIYHTYHYPISINNIKNYNKTLIFKIQKVCRIKDDMENYINTLTPNSELLLLSKVPF
jgi:hypothetical protein